jgi:L-threonylcarbamoyladenylate synthase
LEVMVVKGDCCAPDSPAIAAAAVALRRGGLVIVPTETVYGIACLASDESAVKRIYEAKGRGFHNPLPVQISGPDMLGKVAAEVTEPAKRLAERFWPGPLTLVVRRNPSLPEILTAGGDTVAVRIPDHPVTLALLKAIGAPLAITSANVSGEMPATTCAEAPAALGEWVEVALDGGDCRIGVPSTVVDTTGSKPRILREGAIGVREIMETLKECC